MTAGQISTMHVRRLLTYGSLSLLTACATMPSSLSLGKQEGTGAPSAASSPSLTSLVNSTVDIPEVQAVGAIPPPPAHTWADEKEDLNEHRALGYGLVSIPVMEEYLNNLYKKAKQLADVPDWPGKVYISSDTSFNAHSSAAGNLYLNIAVLQSAESEDEIFAVISHEFAHVYLNHQAAYRSKLMTGTAVFLGKAAVAVATKNAGAAKWNAADTLSVAGKMTDDVLIPTWQRSVEEQADRFGVTLSLKAGYSYPAGFKTFLERLASVERIHNEKVAAEEKATAEQKAAKDQQAQQARWDVKWSEAMRNTVTDSTASLARKLLPGASSAVQNHDDAEVREKTLTAEVRALPKSPRVRPQLAPWKEVTKNKSVAEVFAHFNLLSKVDELAQARRFPEAIKLANVAASGATEADGTSVITLFKLLREENRLPLDAQIAVLLRNQNSLHRSWAAQEMAAKSMATTNPAQAKVFIEQQFEYFGKAPSTFPDMIGFYVESLKSPLLAATLNVPCMVANPRYRQACIDRSLTDTQRQTNKAAQDARTETMGKNLAEKFSKGLGFK